MAFFNSIESDLYFLINSLHLIFLITLFRMNNSNNLIRKSKSLNCAKNFDDLNQSHLVLVPPTLYSSYKSYKESISFTDLLKDVSNLNKKLPTTSSNLFTCSQPNTIDNKTSKSYMKSVIISEISSFHAELDSINESPENDSRVIILPINDFSSTPPLDVSFETSLFIDNESIISREKKPLLKNRFLAFLSSKKIDKEK